MKDSKNIVIGLLCTVLCIMAVAYAAFSTQLTVNGTATVSSTWNVTISDITCTPVKATGGVDLAEITPKIENNSTTAVIDIAFKQPGDKATCVVTIANNGSLDAYLASIVTQPETVTNVTNTDAIHYTIGQGTGDAKVNDTLAKQNTHKYTIVAEYVDVKDGNGQSVELTEAQKSRQLVVSFNYLQKMTQAGA